jgi:hypothetical protein
MSGINKASINSALQTTSPSPSSSSHLTRRAASGDATGVSLQQPVNLPASLQPAMGSSSQAISHTIEKPLSASSGDASKMFVFNSGGFEEVVAPNIANTNRVLHTADVHTRQVMANLEDTIRIVSTALQTQNDLGRTFSSEQAEKKVGIIIKFALQTFKDTGKDITTMEKEKLFVCQKQYLQNMANASIQNVPNAVSDFMNAKMQLPTLMVKYLPISRTTPAPILDAHSELKPAVVSAFLEAGIVFKAKVTKEATGNYLQHLLTVVKKLEEDGWEHGLILKLCEPFQDFSKDLAETYGKDITLMNGQEVTEYKAHYLENFAFSSPEEAEKAKKDLDVLEIQGFLPIKQEGT